MSEKTGQNGSASGPATEPAGPPLPHFGNERDRIPERIGHFKILDLVAAGMALVYKAEQETPHRIVALKIPRGGKLLSEETRRRFMREVELTAGMDHAGIVPVYEAGEIDGVPFYTMPFIEGRSLAQHIEMEKPDMAARLDIFSRLCQVVAALHATGLVHRDLKPENVMLDRHGNIRLLDFGLAKVLADAETFTGDQALLGTLQCMAPEQTQPGKHGDITPAADVYALGMILYWLLTDEFPYSTKGSRDEALRTIREFQPESPGKRKGGISESLDRIVMACLAKSRKLRPQSGGELQKIVRAAMDGKTPLPPLPVDAATSKSSGKLPVAAICVVVLALIVGAVLILRPLILNRRQEPMRPVQQRPALVTEKTPPPVAVKTPARVDVHAPEAIDAMAGGRPVGKADPSVPAKLWPVYEKARAALRDDFSLRGSGAVLVNAAGDAAVRITWRVEGGAEFSKSVEPRGAMVIYVEANRLYTIESVSGGKIIRRTASAGPGEVRYIEMGGTAAKRTPRAR